MLKVSDFNYQLPSSFIANAPAVPRDHSRLIVVNRARGILQHRYFYNLADLLSPNDVLVLNKTKVFPARLLGKKTTGGKVELLLLKQLNAYRWEAISKPGVKNGQIIKLSNYFYGKVIKQSDNHGLVQIQFNLSGQKLFNQLQKVGLTPIPPYIKPTQSEKEIKTSYQTVYAKEVGSAAAPTAGLHFTKQLINKLKMRGVGIEYITLHVGLGTFQPLREEKIVNNILHVEPFEISPATANKLNQAKEQGKRIIAVGTTTVRALESATKLINSRYQLMSKKSQTNIFIYPPYKFKFVDSLITNFHLPKSSLLMLVSAFVSYPNCKNKFTSFSPSLIGKAYKEAMVKHYHFYSFGDATWLI